ncbi:hypothetical protein EW142_10970 [Flagellimonas allohymeniacidonis]|uniref:DUF6268 domain-containing protein n=2 Tax=Flagellimonas allohymeniacidonis TaxID=2517819 RepID=A0A4V6MM95_9FLAO|nr:hypothetical protein EW142_10970 [Allomuricauda hymeniacidonis]
MISSTLQAQIPREIASFDYSLLPNINNTDISETSIRLNHQFNWANTTLQLHGTYLQRQYQFYGNTALINFGNFETTHFLQFKGTVNRSLGKNWKLQSEIAPSLASNLENGLSTRDWVLNQSVGLVKEWNGPNRKVSLKFGAGRGTFFGKPQFVPILKYGISHGNKWSLNLGFPKSDYIQVINERNSIASFIAVNGTYTNLSGNISIDDLGTFEHAKLVQNGIDFGLEYLFRIQPNFTTSLKSGYSMVNSLEIQDENENILYDFDPNGSVYISIGLKYNIK